MLSIRAVREKGTGLKKSMSCLSRLCDFMVRIGAKSLTMSELDPANPSILTLKSSEGELSANPIWSEQSVPLS